MQWWTMSREWRKKEWEGEKEKWGKNSKWKLWTRYKSTAQKLKIEKYQKDQAVKKQCVERVR